MPREDTADRSVHAQQTADALRARAEKTRAHVEKRQPSAYFSAEAMAMHLADADLNDAAAFYIQLALSRGALQ